jgi:deazaflavin-dependent oxidoreductase (nitroreductase family)
VTSSLFTRQPSGLLRAGLRLPIWLYRLHLGWLLGDRFLMITHLGRKTGLPHRTVVEVVRHDKSTDGCVVASGWGAQSDWYRNIQHTPQVTITLGRHRWPATAEVLSERAAEEALGDYARRHPHAYRELASMIAGHRLSSAELNSAELAKIIPLVAFYPDQPGTS